MAKTLEVECDAAHCDDIDCGCEPEYCDEDHVDDEFIDDLRRVHVDDDHPDPARFCKVGACAVLNDWGMS